jgi:hypothetical protein
MFVTLENILQIKAGAIVINLVTQITPGYLPEERANYSGLRLIEEVACLRARHCTATMRERSLRSSETAVKLDKITCLKWRQPSLSRGADQIAIEGRRPPY